MAVCEAAFLAYKIKLDFFIFSFFFLLKVG